MYNTGAYSTRAQRSTQQGQGHLYSKGAFNTRSQYKDIRSPQQIQEHYYMYRIWAYCLVQGYSTKDLEVSTADTGTLLYV